MRQIFIVLRRTLAAGLLAMALAACSGGGGGGSSFYAPAGITTATISGAVSGSTFVAVDAASNAEIGRVAASSAAAGGQKTFSLPLPPGRTHKFYLIENDRTADARIFPLYQGAANKFTISAITAIDLGLIGTTTGIAVPANDMTKVGGVTGSGEDTPIPATLAGSAFTVADLARSWNVLQITGGTDAGWQRSSVTIDAGGTASVANYVSSAGSGTTPSTLYAIYPSGVVTFSGGTAGGFRGIMSKDKGMVVGTFSPKAGDYTLIVMFKAGGTYSQADLRGTWAFSQLITGASPAWTHGDATIDASGNMSIAGEKRSSGAGSTSSALLTINATGIVASGATPSFYGVLSRDKNLMVAVDTNNDGTYSLMLFTRTNGTIFDGSDLKGIWRTNWLSAGNGSRASYYGRALFVSDGLVSDAYGDVAAAMTLIQLSSVVQADFALTGAVGSTALVTFKYTDFLGSMSIGKNVMIGTWTESNGNPSLYMFVK